MGDGRHAFGPSCTEFVHPEYWHFGNDASIKINDVLTEHGGLLHVLTLAVHLRFFLMDKCETFLLFEFFCGTPPSCLKVIGWGGVVGWLGGVVAYEILVSAQEPLGFGFWGFGAKGLGPGLDNDRI
mgnify:CR=1 FL=1